METLEVEELDKQWGIKEAKMIIFSSRIIKSEYGHPSCRQVEIFEWKSYCDLWFSVISMMD